MVLRENELISVVMSAYNAEKTIAESIESVLRQTYRNFDFIIINDGSNDDAGNLIKEYARIDNRIKIIEHSNRGMAKSLNIGINTSRNKWIARLDADDIMLENRLEKQIKFINNNPSVKVVSCRAYYINEKGNVLGKTINHLKSIDAFEKLVENNEVIGLLHPGVMMEKQVFTEVGGYRGEFWPAEDIDLWTRISEKGHKILIQDDILMKYRIHENSIVTSNTLESQMKFEWVKKCKECRTQNIKEPDYKTFLNEFEAYPFYKRFNKRRKIKAKINYRAAGYDFMTKNYFLGIVRLLISLLLKPSYVIRKLSKQII